MILTLGENLNMPNRIDRKSPIRIMLDTNIWSEFAKADVGPDLHRAIKRTNNIIVVPPLILFEALATPADEYRRRLVRLLTMPTWTRLMPEAYTLSQEIISEVKRLRPEWLRHEPKTQRFHKLRYDWTRKTRGFWERARYRSELLRNALREDGGWPRNLLEMARKDYADQRSLSKEQGIRDIGSLKNCEGTFPAPLPEGITDEPIQFWRIRSWASVTRALAYPEHPLGEWLTPFLDFDRMQFSLASWNRFWLREVNEKQMKCFWLHYAFEMLQSVQKVTPGTPADAALSVYLCEADLVISADKNFIRNIDGVRNDAPCGVPIARIVQGGSSGIQETLDIVNNYYL